MQWREPGRPGTLAAQIRGRADLDQAAGVHAHDPVGFPHARKAVGNDPARTPFHGGCQPWPHQDSRFRIRRAHRLIIGRSRSGVPFKIVRAIAMR